jgi:Domain of unknown function (DUF4232)
MPNRPSAMAVAAAVVAVLCVAACAAGSSASGTNVSGTGTPGTGTPGTGTPGTGTTGIGTVTPGSGVSPQRARPEPACTTSQLTITLTRKGAAVMGEVGGYLRFANSGRATCQIGGWPAVTAVTAAGRTITAARAWHGMMLGDWQYAPPLPVLRLAPGAAAYAVLAAGDHSARTTRTCPVVRWLWVTPPAGSGHVTLSARLYGRVYLPACTSFRGTTEIQFSAVVPLADLPH